MSPNRVEQLEEFLSKSFCEGVYSRELRLSSEELDFIRKKYSHVQVKKCMGAETADGKAWYEVCLTAVSSGPAGRESVQHKSDELAAIRQENLRLRRELELLKKTMKFA